MTLGWLCLGWPDERPPAPGLQRAGWSKRLPLADVAELDRCANQRQLVGVLDRADVGQLRADIHPVEIRGECSG